MSPFRHSALALRVMGLVVGLMITSGIQGARPQVIAHRGASHYAPENTMPAFMLGWQMGADAVELDVHLTGDGHPVVIHDETTKRTTGKDILVRTAKFEELIPLDAGAWKGPAHVGQKIPLLLEAARAIPAGTRLIVEIKVGPEAVEPVKKVLEQSGKAESCVIIAFKKETASFARKRMPNTPVYWLIGTQQDKETGVHRPIPIQRAKEAKEAGFDGLNVSYHGITPELVQACKDEGIELWTWTVDHPADAVRLAEMGITAITTNRPDTILKALEEMPPAEKTATP